MSFSNTDLLKHILDEAAFIHSNLEGLTVDKLEANPILQRAFIRSIEITGEAAKNVKTEFSS